jgi:putative protein-disulfide isomerase
MIKLFFLTLIIMLSLKTSAFSQEEKLYYVMDPLCGWCYAFSPEMEKIAETFKDEMKIVVVSGGMVRGERIGPIGETAAYIKEAYRVVERGSSVKFGQAFLDHLFNDGSHVFSSIEPSIALVVVKELQPDKALQFSSYLHQAIYVDGLPPTQFESYVVYAEKVGIDRSTFLDYCQKPEMKQRAEIDFNLSSGLGVNGFPTLVYYNGKDLQVISRGYAPSRDIVRRIDAVRR